MAPFSGNDFTFAAEKNDSTLKTMVVLNYNGKDMFIVHYFVEYVWRSESLHPCKETGAKWPSRQGYTTGGR